MLAVSFFLSIKSNKYPIYRLKCYDHFQNSLENQEKLFSNHISMQEILKLSTQSHSNSTWKYKFGTFNITMRPIKQNTDMIGVVKIGILLGTYSSIDSLSFVIDSEITMFGIDLDNIQISMIKRLLIG